MRSKPLERWVEAQVGEMKGWKEDIVDSRVLRKEQTKAYLYTYLWEYRFNDHSFENQTILEVGCGPYGFVSILQETALKIWIDPLMSFYKKSCTYSNDDAQYMRGIGEILPLRSSSMDVVFCYNVLDHVVAPVTVLNEIRRVLKTGGLLILAINVWDPLSAYIRKQMEKKELSKFFMILDYQKDTCHPHNFTPSQFMNLLNKLKFEILHGTIATPIKPTRVQAPNRVRRIVLKLLPFEPGFRAIRLVARKL
jgi:SAM-dependent methyltransferase